VGQEPGGGGLTGGATPELLARAVGVEAGRDVGAALAVDEEERSLAVVDGGGHADVDAEDPSLEPLLDLSLLERAGIVVEDDVPRLHAREVAVYGGAVLPPLLRLQDRLGADEEARAPLASVDDLAEGVGELRNGLAAAIA